MKTCPGRMSWIGSRASQTEGLRQTDGETLSDGELLSYNRPSHKKQLATRGCLAALGRGDTNDDRERGRGSDDGRWRSVGSYSLGRPHCRGRCLGPCLSIKSARPPPALTLRERLG